MRARRTFAVLFVTASLALAGCGAGSGDSGESKPAYAEKAKGAAGPDSAADGAATEADAKAGPEETAGTSAPDAAHIIRTASLSVEVKDATAALADARAAAEKAGGRVENETTERADGTHVTSRVVLRVPQEAYGSVLSELAGAGRLLSRQADAKDVTDQVVDVESRIATQRASVARVRELMERATRLSDVVTLEGELSSRQAELESLLAKQASLKDRTELATITLVLTEPEREEKEKDDGAPGFLDALGGGWDALVATVRWIAVVLGAVAPFAAVGAALYVLWRLLIRPWRSRRGRDTTAPAGTPGAGLPSYPGTSQATAPPRPADPGEGTRD
ncbi:DUF4349 domain-containing protein [Streptomyces sp. t39]|uniref:DUF4349 domain-containing protein n=1 Tax=Streptomyces sp. t39 TaxID=1828156 RepID=UPI0011CDBF9E|nr:DUF4349 domain-containing protein [Streptomyces sp. t39]TXS57378.1 DUF4349 domain-containing protein [Streptomyces sp. t39]